MNGITIKSILLGIGIIILICLLIHIPNKGYHRVTIVEKYYAANPKNNSKAVGVTTKKKISVPTSTSKPYCAMQFSNGKILNLDCHTYLDYEVKEKVKIKWKGNKLVDIRRK
ncbi:hypothetical protein [Heyndrickxia ginsengihumi]|uniref:hypothetical protein n=1 Tax=Heyndrickxia ginsengihumi TaxID=363870 RepID=UPI00046E87AD|nr:hypothetical protein [Heyndrickxia ginsengihumi]